jgi:hypothetical protein
MITLLMVSKVCLTITEIRIFVSLVIAESRTP